MKDLFDIFPEPGERQTDIELIIEEKKEMDKKIAAKLNEAAETIKAAAEMMVGHEHLFTEYENLMVMRVKILEEAEFYETAKPDDVVYGPGFQTERWNV